jgi:hypothetical protein
MTTYLVRHTCRPKPGTDAFVQFSKAYVFVWVLDDTQVDAEQRAVRHIDEQGWSIISHDGVYVFDREIAAKDPFNLAAFNKVQRLGITAEFITSPAGDAPHFS